MNTSSHRRIAEVERYIHELAIALSGLPADERDDVIAGVRGHIDDALAGIADPAPADVQRILDDLGDPVTIAAHAGAPSGAPGHEHAGASSGSPTRAASSSTAPLLQREWVPVTVVLSFAAAGLLLWLGGPGLVALPAILWLAGIVVLWASPLWRLLEKAVGTVIFVGAPAILLAFGPWSHLLARALEPARSYLPIPGVSPRNLSRWVDPAGYIGGWLLLAIGLAAVVITGTWLLRRGTSRVPR